MKLIINSDGAFSRAVGTISAEYQQHKHLTLTVKAGIDRTAQQNRLWAAMYKRLQQHGLFETGIEAKKYCKLLVGVPILLEESPDFAVAWRDHFGCLGYEEQIEMMGPCSLFGAEGFPVTRLFTRPQGRRYTEDLANHHEFVVKCVSFHDLLRGDK